MPVSIVQHILVLYSYLNLQHAIEQCLPQMLCLCLNGGKYVALHSVDNKAIEKIMISSSSSAALCTQFAAIFVIHVSANWQRPNANISKPHLPFCHSMKGKLNPYCPCSIRSAPVFTFQFPLFNSLLESWLFHVLHSIAQIAALLVGKFHFTGKCL